MLFGAVFSRNPGKQFGDSEAGRERGTENIRAYFLGLQQLGTRSEKKDIQN